MNKKTSLYIYIGIIFGLLVVAAAVLFALKSGSVFNPAENSESSPFLLEYRNEPLGFSFSYPEGFKITEFSEEQGEVLLAENEAGKSFQIFIQAFDEPGPLTQDRILQDIQAMNMKNFRAATFDGVQALVFEQEEPSFGPTFEVWFVWPEIPQPNGNYLYQITSKAWFGEELTEILKTWRFEETN